jgi:Zn-dependent metalloprotease
VHYGTKYDNAFWSDACFCMTYGDGNNFLPLVSLDVAGHEMSHGVTSRTAGLVYSGESGGLNEGTSDIFGTAVEFYANSPKDVPDYLIGEKLLKTGKGALRYMDDPKRDGNSASCWTSSVGGKDVHYSSGVANHFFFNLSVGTGARSVNGVSYNSPTCSGAPAMTGIGINKAEKIWFRALTTYFTSGTKYAAARTATLKAATDLYGANSAEYKATAAAWTAVAVN